MMTPQGLAVIALAFVGAFCGIVAAASPDVLPPVVKLLAAATAAGCGAVLALLRPPGVPHSPPPSDPASLPPRIERTR